MFDVSINQTALTKTVLMDQHSSTPQADSYQIETPTQESIFTDLVDDSQYDRNLRNARIWLYIIAGLQLAVGCYEYYDTPDPQLAWIVFGIYAFIGAIFLVLSLWSKKKPVTVFLSALIFYIAVILARGYFEPASIIKGVIFKIFFVIALIKAYRDAKESHDIKKAARLDVS